MKDDTSVAVGDVVTIPVTSMWGSRTNLTAILMAVFGGLVAVGWLPPALSDPETVGGIVAAGAALVAYFRTAARSLVA